MKTTLLISVLLAQLLAACHPQAHQPVVAVRPVLATDPVADDPDDPAIWVNPADPARSLIFGTNKVKAPSGAVVVYGLDGKLRQTVAGIDRPNNIDVEYGLALGGEAIDIAVVTERYQSRLRVFRISGEGTPLTEIAQLPVFEGETGEYAMPMGIAMYRRPSDGAVFAIVSRKDGPRRGYLWQYRLVDAGDGTLRGMKVREFGVFSGAGEIEAIAVDDELGYVYYADEGDGIHKWHANPDHPGADRELARFGTEGFQGDREGIAIYALDGGRGYILCTDQIDGNSRYWIYRREGTPEDPHDHFEALKVVAGGADSTDGLEATSAYLGPRFPAGLVIAMNSRARNFLVFRWEEIARTGAPTLEVAAPTPNRGY